MLAAFSSLEHAAGAAGPQQRRGLVPTQSAVLEWSGSPDPTCLIRLHDVTHLWFFKELPVIWSRSDLNTSPWFDYLHKVYGEFEDQDFPIDLRCFTFWWKHHVPVSERPLFLAHFVSRSEAEAQGGARDGNVLDIGYRKLAWQIYLLSHDPGNSSRWPVDPLSQRAVLTLNSSHVEGRIEVFHDMDDCPHALGGFRPVDYETIARQHRQYNYSGDHPESNYWVHFAPGSGFFLPLGNSMIAGADGYWEACAKIFGRGRSCAGSAQIHDLLWLNAHKQGIDSLQSCCGIRGGVLGDGNYFEITFYGSQCLPHNALYIEGVCPDRPLSLPSHGACPVGIEPTTGWAGNRACYCDPTLVVSNCDRTLRNPPVGPRCGFGGIDRACLPRLALLAAEHMIYGVNSSRVDFDSASYSDGRAKANASSEAWLQFGCNMPQTPVPAPFLPPPSLPPRPPHPPPPEPPPSPWPIPVPPALSTPSMVPWLAAATLPFGLLGVGCCLKQQRFSRRRGAYKSRYSSVETDVTPADDLDALIDDILKTPDGDV